MKDNSGTSVIWKSRTDGANKPQNTRPLAIFPGKESTELLKEFVPIVEAEIKEIKDDGIKIDVKSNGSVEEDQEVLAQCCKVKMSMIDGKMINSLSGLGGAFCTMCSRAVHKKQILEI